MFFFGQEAPQKKPVPQLREEAKKEEKTEPEAKPAVPSTGTKPVLESAVAPKPERPARQLMVETPLYKAVLSEKGGGISSFSLKNIAQRPLMTLL